ncbi:MAG TPA: hypothetical protein VGH33_27140, partial [Isosphaeraceae bacterium]
TFDIHAQEAGVIRVTLLEEGTRKPVAGARIWGFDAETGSSARFNAYTDGEGRATFRSVATKISLSLAGPPEGVYLSADLRRYAGAASNFDFNGGEHELTLTMPPIAGRLVSVPGLCTRPDGSRAEGVTVSAVAGKFKTLGTTNYIRDRRTDGLGQFTLEAVPDGRPIHFYALSDDRKLAARATAKAPEKSDHASRIKLALTPTVAVEYELKDAAGKPMADRKFHLTPKVGEDEFLFLRRPVETDGQGRLVIDGVLPGLAYHVQEATPPAAGGVVVQKGVRSRWFDEVIVLAPEE